MADGKLSEQQISAFHRLLQHLPKDNDLSLLALKGHLLMEERLFLRQGPTLTITAVDGTPAWFTRNSMYGPGGARVGPVGPAPVRVVGPVAANATG